MIFIKLISYLQSNPGWPKMPLVPFVLKPHFMLVSVGMSKKIRVHGGKICLIYKSLQTKLLGTMVSVNAGKRNRLGLARTLLLFLVSLLGALGAHAQHLTATISPDPSKHSAKIDAVFSESVFIVKLPETVSWAADELHCFDREGRKSDVTEARPRQFVALKGVVRCIYSVSVLGADIGALRAHRSWIAATNGILMLGDLLPENGRDGAAVRVELPVEWNVTGEHSENEAITFQNASAGVIPIGKDWRRSSQRARQNDVELIIADQWPFSDAEAVAVAAKIGNIYAASIGPLRAEKPAVVMFRMPQGTPPGQWEAETRGTTIVITSSDMPFASQSLQRLNEQLRHEMFHLWFPNGVALSGRYDWFYEGAAQYVSLLTAVRTGTIRFEDMLDTLSRAMTIEAAYPQQDLTMMYGGPVAANILTYARGLTIAFLFDIAMLERSNGKSSFEDILRELYRAYPMNRPGRDATQALLAEFGKYGELTPLVDALVTAKRDVPAVNVIQLLGKCGIADAVAGTAHKLSAMQKLSSRQKALLDKLGYNAWRSSTKDLK